MATSTKTRERVAKKDAPEGAPATTPRAWRNVTAEFGLVSIPISIGPLHDAGSPIGGKMLCPDHGVPLRRRWLCEEDEAYFKDGETAKGYEYNGEYIQCEKDEIDELSDSITQSITIERVSPNNIDPIYYDKTYQVWADTSRSNGQAFDIFTEALRTENKVAVGSCCFMKQTRLVVFRYSEAVQGLVAHVCFFNSTIRWPNVEMVRESTLARPTPKISHVKAAKPLLAALDGDFDPSEVEDEFTPALQKMLEAKSKGKTFRPKATKKASVTDDPPDVMASLRESVEAIKKNRRATKK